MFWFVNRVARLAVKISDFPYRMPEIHLMNEEERFYREGIRACFYASSAEGRRSCELVVRKRGRVDGFRGLSWMALIEG